MNAKSKRFEMAAMAMVALELVSDSTFLSSKAYCLDDYQKDDMDNVRSKIHLQEEHFDVEKN